MLLCVSFCIAGQIEYEAAMTHFYNCAKIGDMLQRSNKPLDVVIKYDELCRKRWAELSEASIDFDINAVARQTEKVSCHCFAS